MFNSLLISPVIIVSDSNHPNPNNFYFFKKIYHELPQILKQEFLAACGLQNPIACSAANSSPTPTPVPVYQLIVSGSVSFGIVRGLTGFHTW